MCAFQLIQMKCLSFQIGLNMIFGKGVSHNAQPSAKLFYGVSSVSSTAWKTIPSKANISPALNDRWSFVNFLSNEVNRD